MRLASCMSGLTTRTLFQTPKEMGIVLSPKIRNLRSMFTIRRKFLYRLSVFALGMPVGMSIRMSIGVAISVAIRVAVRVTIGVPVK